MSNEQLDDITDRLNAIGQLSYGGRYFTAVQDERDDRQPPPDDMPTVPTLARHVEKWGSQWLYDGSAVNVGRSGGEAVASIGKDARYERVKTSDPARWGGPVGCMRDVQAAFDRATAADGEHVSVVFGQLMATLEVVLGKPRVR